MGWGLQKSDRDAMLQSCLISTVKSKAKASVGTVRAAAAAGPRPKAAVAVADMNAKLRQKAVDVSGGGARLSMQRVVRNVVREVAKDAAEHMILVFDAPCVMPAVRSVLWQTRYAGGGAGGGAARPPKPADIQAGTALCARVQRSTAAARAPPPVPYSVMFTPGAAKKATWDAMTLVARREAAVVAAEHGIRATVVDADNILFDTAGPGALLVGWTQETQGYGEADLKIYALGQAAAAASNPTGPKAVVLHSVDTDLILQAVATVRNSGPGGNAWVPRENFIIKLKTCTVDGRELMRTFGGRSAAKRLNSAFWFVMAGGTDYSRPASDQGYAKRALADAAHPLVVSAAPFTNLGPVDARQVLTRLKGTRKVARTVCGKAKRSGRSLKRCLEQAAAVVRYYGLIETDPDVALF